MPELPDIVVYIEHLEASLIGQRLERTRLMNPFVLRSVTPPIASAEGKKVVGVRRIGKRIVYAENETNYCARCQTGGKVLADRALSRLLKASWPRSIDELD